MDNKLMVFEGNQVEVFKFEGKVLFNPYDVGKCLDIKDINSVTRDFSEKQLVTLKNSDLHTMHIRKLNNRGEHFLTESGVYKLIFKSRKPEAEKFQNWVTDEVLPSIRQNGGYIATTEEDDAETIMAKALIVAQKTIEKKNQLLAAKTEELKEKDDFINKISSSKTSILVRELAHIISDQYFKIGEYKLVDKLREFNLIYKNSREPYQQRIEQGLFEVSEFPIQTNHGVILKKTTKITGKGQAYIINKLLKELN